MLLTTAPAVRTENAQGRPAGLLAALENPVAAMWALGWGGSTNGRGCLYCPQIEVPTSLPCGARISPTRWRAGNSLCTFRVYNTTGTISAQLLKLLLEFIGLRAKPVKGFSWPSSQAQMQWDCVWFSIPRSGGLAAPTLTTGACTQRPCSCTAAHSSSSFCFAT